MFQTLAALTATYPSRSNTNMLLNNVPIEWVDNFKFLGVVFTIGIVYMSTVAMLKESAMLHAMPF